MIIVDGNEAVSLGALLSGAKFYASYPITPATSIGDTLANYFFKPVDSLTRQKMKSLQSERLLAHLSMDTRL
jgi:pyruvate/2-oxoacid:ferredoxin oxidoreductase alpha subunit